MATAPPLPDPTSIAWRVVRDEGPAAEFHQREPDTEPGHQLWVRRLPGPALILGSTQPDELVRADRAAADGIEVCGRRSGGGLVHVDPATDCWIDAIVPADSPLWHRDVGLAFHWLGQVWADVLDERLGPAGPALVHRAPPRSGRSGRALWCFADRGHGEVTVGASKVVGLSQRRTRTWVRLQSLVLGAWPGRRLLPYLDLDVAASLVGRHADTSSIDRNPSIDRDPAIDPGAVRAGPPPGVRLPDPEALADAFIGRFAEAG